MPDLKPPVELELSENEARVKYLLEEASGPDFDFPQVRKFVMCTCYIRRCILELYCLIVFYKETC